MTSLTRLPLFSLETLKRLESLGTRLVFLTFLTGQSYILSQICLVYNLIVIKTIANVWMASATVHIMMYIMEPSAANVSVAIILTVSAVFILLFFTYPVVGCRNFPDACGTGKWGDCVEPGVPAEKYTCTCKNNTHVKGKDCDSKLLTVVIYISVS